MNASEPLKTCQEGIIMLSKQNLVCGVLEQIKCNLDSSFIGNWQKGGMTLNQAYCMNVGTVISMLSEKSE